MPATSELKFNDDYYVRNPDRKGQAWGDRMVTSLRMEWRNIVDKQTMEDNRKIVNAQNDLEKVKKGFKRAENQDGFLENTDFKPIAIYSRIIKILMAEFIKSGLSPHVEAIDVAATDKKKRDKTMMQNRSTLESVMNRINKQVGDPQYKMPLDELEGNVEQFDMMGLDSNSSDDIEFFFSTFYRLWQEISAEKLTRSLMSSNEFDLYVRPLTIDLMAANTMVFQTLASCYTGEIKWYYHDPIVVKAIRGERPDFKDAMCKGFEKNVTVRQWLQFVGSEFDFTKESHRDALRQAVNFFQGTRYSLIDHSGNCWEPDLKGIPQISCDYGTLLTRHSVGCGYIEWLSTDGVAYKKNKQTGIRDTVSYDSIVQSENYEKETEEYERIYKAWFLSTGSNSQMLFRYGRLYHTVTDGNDDELANYSIHIIQSPDITLVDATSQINYIANMAFYKMLWGIYESHPTVEYYDYDAIIDVISHMKPENSSATGDSMFSDGRQVVAQSAVEGQIDQLLKNYANNLRRIFVKPERPQGGTDKPHFTEPGGLDPLSVAMTTVYDWAENKIMDQIIGARNPEMPNPKLGFRVQQKSLENSANATFDIPFSMSLLIKMIATSSLRIAQDGVQFKTKVYDWLLDLIGRDDIMSIKSLDGIPYHRNAIFVDVFNDQQQLEKAKGIALQSLQTKQIDNGQYALLENIDDPKKLLQTLAYFTIKMQKKMEQQAALDHQRQMELAKIKTDGELSVEAARMDREVTVENIRGEYYVAAHKDAAQAELTKKQIDVDSNRQKVNEKADANIRENREKSNLASQEPLPTSVSELQDQPQVGA